MAKNTKKCVEMWKSGKGKNPFPLPQRSKLAESFISDWLDAVRGFPAVQNHTDGGTFDGLVLTCTEFDEIAGGELLRKEREE